MVKAIAYCVPDFGFCYKYRGAAFARNKSLVAWAIGMVYASKHGVCQATFLVQHSFFSFLAF